MTVVAGTGHRPDKLGGYGDDVLTRLYRFALGELRVLKPTKVISGMALGWDTALALAALTAEIPVVAAVPFDSFHSQWPQASQDRYWKIIERAHTVHIVCPPGYKASKMQDRNKWMVDRCDILLALWNGSSGGTANCIRDAERRRKDTTDVTGLFPSVQIINLWDRWAGC